MEQQILFRVDSLCDLRPQGLVPLDEARGQNLELLRFFFLLLIFLNGFIQFKQKVLFRINSLSVTSDCRVLCPRVGCRHTSQGVYVPCRALFLVLFSFYFVIQK